MITSIQNPKIQQVRELLAHSRARREQGAYVIEGIRLLEEAWQAGIQPSGVFFSADLNPRGMVLVEEMRLAGFVTEEVEFSLLKRVSDTEHSQGLLAVLPYRAVDLPLNANFCLILDAIRDPGNMGTILRTACAAGVQSVHLSSDCADIFSPKVLRSAMGAHFHLPIATKSWGEIQEYLNHSPEPPAIFLSDVREGQSLWQCSFTEPTALIISNEGAGASDEARTLTTHVVHIPMPGGFESLNASIAAAILLFEVVRQRANP